MITSLDDPLFGPLRWNAALRCWEAAASLPDGNLVELTIGTPDGAKDQTITAEARAAFARLLHDPNAFTRRAAEDLLPVHNENWHLHAPTPPLTAAQFQAQLTLARVEVKSDGWVSAYFDDGKLIWGTLVVEHRPDGTLWEARFEV